MKRLLHTPTALLLRRIALLYAVLMLCRVISISTTRSCWDR